MGNVTIYLLREKKGKTKMEKTVRIYSYWANRQPVIREALKETGIKDFTFFSKRDRERDTGEKSNISEFILYLEDNIVDELAGVIANKMKKIGYDKGYEIYAD